MQYLADLPVTDAVFYGQNGLVLWKDSEPTRDANHPTPSAACLSIEPKIGGKKIMHGLWAHTVDYGSVMPNISIIGPASRMSYCVGRKYKQLSGSVCISEDAVDYYTAVVCCILADGMLIWRSEPITQLFRMDSYQIAINNCHMLEFVSVSIGTWDSCHVVWVDPILDEELLLRFV